MPKQSLLEAAERLMPWLTGLKGTAFARLEKLEKAISQTKEIPAIHYKAIKKGRIKKYIDKRWCHCDKHSQPHIHEARVK